MSCVESIPQAGSQAILQDYKFFSGDYSNVQLAAGITVEDFQIERIDAALQQSRGLEIALEVGGAASMTAMRLAARFPQAIAAGRLAVVVTNAEATRLEFIKALPEPQRSEALSLYDQTKPLVHELRATLPTDTPLQITLPNNGGVVDLRGRVTFAHERYSVTYWTRTPGPVLALGELMADNALYMVQDYDVKTMERKVGYGEVSTYFEQRGFQHSTRIIDADGRPAESFYHVYHGPQSQAPEQILFDNAN